VVEVVGSVHVGTVLCVAITIMLAATIVVSWCPGCEESFTPRHRGEWFERRHDPDTGETSMSRCHTITGQPLEVERARICEVVATVKDPMDNWHE
jgi:FlaG/FlaF family flagellin (archaellin)